MTCSVYILRSERDGAHYIGSAQDVDVRIEFHNSSRARWTKRHQPWELIHVEEYATRGEAMKRERYLKSLKGIARYLQEIKIGRR